MLPGYFSGEISEKDRTIVDIWRQESPENEKEFRQIQEAWYAYPNLHEMEQYDAFEALLKVNLRVTEQQKRNWITRFQRIAAILIIPLMFFSSYLFIKNQIIKESIPSEPIWQTLSTPPGVKSRFFLPDSTSVWLNSSSSISYPVAFTGEIRHVKVKGEAYLDVRKDKKHPFVVDLGKINVKVLGTRFDVINYEKESKTEILLESGKISLLQGTGEDQKVIANLKPGELAVFRKENDILKVKSVQTAKYTAWKEGKLIFQDDSMDDVVRKLNRWFNVEIEVADPQLLDYIYTAKFQNESIDQILELLTISAPIRYQVNQREKNGDIFSAKRIILRKRK